MDAVLQEFIAYEAALVRCDASSLNGFFWNNEAVVRYGVADQQRGYAELDRWRTTQGPLPGRQLADTQVTTFGTDLAVIATLFFYRGREREITGLGGWRAYLTSREPDPSPE